MSPMMLFAILFVIGIVLVILSKASSGASKLILITLGVLMVLGSAYAIFALMMPDTVTWIE